MEILKVETRRSWFGLRSDLYALVAGDVSEGEPEDHWVKVDQYTLRNMALDLGRSRNQVRELTRQLNLHKNATSAREYTLKELSATVADAVDRAMTAHPLTRTLLDKVGGYASGGLVGQPNQTTRVGEAVSESMMERASITRANLAPAVQAEGTAVTELKTRTNGGEGKTGHGVRVEICKGDKPFVVSGMGQGLAEAQKSIARQIREESVRNTSLDEPEPVTGISASPQDRLSDN